MLKPPTYHEPAPPPPLIDEKSRGKALEKMRVLTRGSGIRPDQITINEVKAQLLSFEAKGFVRLATNYTTSSVPGKIEKGEQIGTWQAFEAAMANMTHETQRDPGKRQNIIDIILKRPDKGYAARDQIIKLDSLARDFVAHESCPICNTTGKTSCGKCAGQGMVTCQTCHGRHNILCPNCRGKGSINQGGKMVPCVKCRGKLRIQCPKCGGRGNMKCGVCKGSGNVSCIKCNSTGYISHIAHVDIIGHLHFDYDRQGLPIELTKLMDAFAPKYVEKKDMEVSVLTGPWEEGEAPETIPIGYKVTVPYGEITFNLGPKKRATCIMLGHNGDLIKGPDFLYDLTKKGQVLLDKASKGEGNVGANLRSAAKYRVLRDAIIVTASTGGGGGNSAGQGHLRSGLSKLLSKYPVGISSDRLLQFMMQAHQAMQIITRKPRIIGLALGTITYTLIAFGYFMKGEAAIGPYLADIPLDKILLKIGIDIILLLAGAAIVTGAAQFAAARALKASLNGLAAPRTIKNIMPRLGWALWAAFGLSAGITGLFYFLSLNT